MRAAPSAAGLLLCLLIWQFDDRLTCCRNSRAPLRAAIQSLRSRFPHVEVECVLQDLPNNNWGQVIADEAPRLTADLGAMRTSSAPARRSTARSAPTNQLISATRTWLRTS